MKNFCSDPFCNLFRREYLGNPTPFLVFCKNETLIFRLVKRHIWAEKTTCPEKCSGKRVRGFDPSEPHAPLGELVKKTPDMGA